MQIKINGNITFNVAKLSGIYAIINRSNNKFYIGESLDINSRIKKHYFDLKSNTHHNPLLQSDYNKYGESSFEVVVLTPYMSMIDPLHTKADLLILETAYINRYKNKLYNVESTLDEIINRTRKETDFTDTLIILIRKYIIERLLNFEINWIEQTPIFSPLNTIDNLFDYKFTYRQLAKMIKKVLSDPATKQIAEPISMSYIGINNKECHVSTILVYNTDKFLHWMYKNNFISELPNNKSSLQHTDNHDSYSIPQSVLYKSLCSNKIIDKATFTYKSFKRLLEKNNIYVKNPDGSYSTTDYAKNSNYIHTDDGKHIYFTELGKNAIITLVKNYLGEHYAK